MTNEIFGREKEKKTLSEILDSEEPAFLAIYGRRRIGKTYLIKNFFSDKGTFFHLTGIKGAKTPQQLRLFSQEFRDVFAKESPPPKINDWIEAFTLLRQSLQNTSGKVILFFDELPWLATPKSGFLEALEHFWNRHLSSMKNCILIVCGSAASWMIQKVLNSKGGLHGRITHEIPLFPFCLQETKGFLEKKGINLDLLQVIHIYFAIGGVAKYLTYVKKGYSSSQIINQLCFMKNAPLAYEFQRLYESLFHQADVHIKIIRTLSKKRSGFTYKDLREALRVPSGGTLSKRLRELETSGFIDKIATFGKGKYDEKYILIDEFSLFYITWMENVKYDETPDYWMRQQESSKYTSWKGFAFERLCMKHLQKIKTALGIVSVVTQTSKWSSDGVEIDWVTDRADRCIHLFEAKFVMEKYEIKKEYAAALRKKKELFREATKTRKALFTTLVTPFGAKKNQHYLAAVDQEIHFEEIFS